MEALQMAQMMADLNDLQASQDPSASKALVRANKTLDGLQQDQTRSQSVPTESQAPANAASSSTRRVTDKFGRSIFTPPLSRTNSGTPSSIPGTPIREDGHGTDIDKASTLLSLYEIRAKLKEQDKSGLAKAREKVNALAAKQQGQATAAERSHSRKPSGQIKYPK